MEMYINIHCSTICYDSKLEITYMPINSKTEKWSSPLVWIHQEGACLQLGVMVGAAVAEAPLLPPSLPSPFPVPIRGMVSSVWWSYHLLQGCLLPLFCCGWRHMTNLTAWNQTQIFLKRCSSGEQISFPSPSSEWLGVINCSYLDSHSFLLPYHLPLVSFSFA